MASFRRVIWLTIAAICLTASQWVVAAEFPPHLAGRPRIEPWFSQEEQTQYYNLHFVLWVNRSSTVGVWYYHRSNCASLLRQQIGDKCFWVGTRGPLDRPNNAINIVGIAVRF